MQCEDTISLPGPNITLKPRLLILVGLPGSGKSHIAEQLARAGWGVVNQDKLKNRQRCEKAARRLFDEGRDVVIDRCNCDPMQRATWLLLAKEVFGEHAALHTFALLVATPKQLCIARAVSRKDHPLKGSQAKSVIGRLHKEWIGVQAVEGFTAYAVVTTPSESDAFVDYLAGHGPLRDVGPRGNTSRSNQPLQPSLLKAPLNSRSWSFEQQQEMQYKIRLRLRQAGPAALRAARATGGGSSVSSTSL